MHILEKKTKPAPKAKSENAAPDSSHPGHDFDIRSIMGLQHEIGNQAIQRAFKALSGEFEALRPATAPVLQRKLNISVPDDPLEKEADDVADRVMRMADPSSDSIQREPAGHARGAASGVSGQGGAPLPNGMRSYFEPRFGHDFSGVRVHTDEAAANAARSLQARAYTMGGDIVFGAGEYAPATMEGQRLLAHELAHVVQQRHMPGTGVMRQPVRQATVREAAEFVEAIAQFIDGARSFADTLMRPILPARQPTAAARQRAHRVLNQQRLRDFISNAQSVFNARAGALQGGSTDGTRLRMALLSVITKVREAAPVALNISRGMPAPTPDNESRLNAKLILEMIEADPFTSTGLAGTPSFGTAETRAGASHERFIESYLDDLIRTLPGSTVPAAQRDQILARIQAGLRRAFITIGTGAAGTRGVQGISNTRIVSKYRRVVELLQAGMSTRPTQQSIITLQLPSYTLPNPVPNVTSQLGSNPNIGTVDVSHVPSGEQASVRYGVLQAANTTFPTVSTAQRRNASWPVELQVRRGTTLARVRYDLIFDNSSNVRVERLGEAGPRQVATAFSQLSIAAKKARLITDFGLAGVDDRPAATGRTAALWTSDDLNQIKAAYDLLPTRDRVALHGVAIVRDHQGPPSSTPGQILTGFAHTGPSPAHDTPGPPAHSPPHIHYYDAAFSQNQVTAVGAPGSTGPGGDWTIAHEVGHMRIFHATIQGNAALTAANARITAANAGLPALNASLPHAQHLLRQAYAGARSTANTAIHAYNASLTATPTPTAAQRATLLQAAQAAVVARNQARANLAAGGVPQAMVQAATAFDAAQDALLAASQSLVAAQNQIPIFISLANTFGFTPFTDYARRGGNGEFFAETYALYTTDPNRLSAMNRNIFLWFEAGMPMNAAWRP